MCSCFHQPEMNIESEDSIILFSTSNSPQESSTSPSSSLYHTSPQQQPSNLNDRETSTYNLMVKNLSYTIHPKPTSFYHFMKTQKPKPIDVLKSVSFVAKSSELLAIVGPSGTGKSSLLKILSGRVKDDDFDSSSVFINDRIRNHCVSSPARLRKICGYVAQEDDLLPLLTVKETLMYSAKFRLKDTSSEERENRVEKLLLELGLNHVCDSFVGDEENRGISGGERKRVSIGVDLIHDPAILLLDEPTSGLDSTSALQVIELLSLMAKEKRRTVVLSIHQPSYRIVRYVSNFLILAHGSVVHDGSIESLEENIAKLGFQIPSQLNAIEYAMEIIDTLECNRIRSAPQQQRSYETIWQDGEIDELYGQIDTNPNYNGFSRFFNFFEITVLCSRFWKIIYRTKQLFLARTMQALVGGLGLASVYVKIKKDEAGVTERLGLFAFSLSFLLSSTVEALPIYLQERRVLMKETSRGSYGVSSYMIANTIVFLPFLFVVAILFAAPVYWIVGLNPTVPAFTFFVFVVWLIVMMASSLVLFLTAISPDFISGNSLICTVLGAFFLFSGYFIPKEQIPKYWVFMYYVSMYRYPLDSLITNEYWSARNECFSRDGGGGGGGGGGGLMKCVLSGNDVLKSRGLEKDTRWMDVCIMFGFFVFYRLLCWVVLARKASKTII